MKNTVNAVVVQPKRHGAQALAVLAALCTFAVAMAFQLLSGSPVDASAGFAAITWNFAGVTAEFEGLGTAIVAGLGLAIAAGLVVWGLIRGFKPMLRVLGRLIG